MLAVRHVSKSYGDVVALDDVSMAIDPGEIVCLLGANGAGKTTLLSIVVGLLRPDAGSVTLGRNDIKRDRVAAQRTLGYAAQEVAVYPVTTVQENLRIFGQMAGLRRQTLSERLDVVSTAMGLTGLLDRVVRTLSGGERRRLHVAIALLKRPAYLILDEPTAGVDIESRRCLVTAVQEAARDGATVCYSTHNMAEVEALNSSVVILDHGSAVSHGSLEDMVKEHGRTYVELEVDGEVPPSLLDRLGADHMGDGRVRVATDGDGGTVAHIVGALAEHSTLRSVEVIRPSLDSVYLERTGRRYASDGDPS